MSLQITIPDCLVTVGADRPIQFTLLTVSFQVRLGELSSALFAFQRGLQGGCGEMIVESTELTCPWTTGRCESAHDWESEDLDVLNGEGADNETVSLLCVSRTLNAHISRLGGAIKKLSTNKMCKILCSTFL